MTVLSAPNAPTIYVTNVGDGTRSIYISPVRRATRYAIFRGVAAGVVADGEKIFDGLHTLLPFVEVTNTPSGVTYYYAAVAYNDNSGTETESAEVEVETSGGDAGFQAAPEDYAYILGGDAIAGSAGGDAVIRGGQGNGFGDTAGAGGSITAKGGTDAGVGGDVNIAGGAGNANGDAPGAVVVAGGAGAASTSGAKLTLTGGSGDAGADAGARIELRPGDGSGNNGLIVIVAGLPTSDPTVAGALWNDTGTLKVSAGV